MKIITFQDIEKLNILPEECYKWVSDMILNKDKVILPTKASMKPFGDVFCNVMPCILAESEGAQYGGVKVVTRYPHREPSLDSKLLLLDIKTGKNLALMDANWITAMRTGAVAAHSVQLFAKRNFRTIGIMGLGNTGRAFLLSLVSIMPDKEFNIKILKYKGQEQLFKERFAGFSNLKFSYVNNYEELVRETDVVVSAVTYLDEDICSEEWFEEGVLVVPIHTRGFTNCDLFFDKVFADDKGHVYGFKNFDKFKAFAEVSDVVNGVACGRENDRERILAYNIGVSMHDINFAAHIYNKMKDNENIVEFDFQEPETKFWI